MGIGDAVNRQIENHPSLQLLKRTGKEWLEDEAPRLSAALAYYAIFAIAPLILLTVVVAGFVFGAGATQQQIMQTLGGVIGPQGASVIQSMVEARGPQGSGVIATVIGVAVLLFAASAVFTELKADMNKVWEVEKQGGGIKSAIKDKILAFGMVALVGLLVLASLIMQSLLGAVGPQLVAGIPGGAILWQVVGYVVTFAVLLGGFMVIYRYLPDVDVAWRDVALGAAFTAVLFVIGEILISMYLSGAAVQNSYGAAGSLIAVLLWIYYSGMIFFFGAEFTQVYANMFGSRLKPEQGARPRQGQAPGEPKRPSEPEEGGGRGRPTG